MGLSSVGETRAKKTSELRWAAGVDGAGSRLGARVTRGVGGAMQG